MVERQEWIGENDCSGNVGNQKNTSDGEVGSTLLETVRLLVKLSPDERAALIGLLKAMG